MKEFNLSNRFVEGEALEVSGGYSEEDVKMFIKKLKEEINRLRKEGNIEDDLFLINDCINILAGDNLK